MKTKVIIFVLGLFIVQFIASCCKDVEFLDFTEMIIVSAKDTISTNDTLILEIQPTDPVYISNLNQFGFSSSYATTCNHGWGGMKFSITKIEITSDTDFDVDHLAGTALNDLFKSKAESVNSIEEDIPEDLKSVYYAVYPKLILNASPSLSQEHIFTVTFTKSNDEKVVAASDKIVWN